MPLMDWFYVFVAVNGLFLLVMALYISMLRIKTKSSYGDGDSIALKKAIRVHVNGAEQVPIFGLLLIALAFSGTTHATMGTLVVIFTLSRLAHAYGMLFKVFRLRQVGATATYAMQAAAIVALVLSLVG